MQTSQSMSLNENVAAACAPASNDDYTGRTAVVSGWGTLRPGQLYCIEKEKRYLLAIFMLIYGLNMHF